MDILLLVLILDELVGILRRIGIYVLVLAGLYLWGYVGTFLHEMAHVLIGSLLGYVPYRVEIGRGKSVLYSRTLRGIEFCVYEFPFGGKASLYAVPHSGNRWRDACMLGAGMLADVLLTCVLLVWLVLGIVASQVIHPLFNVFLIPNIFLVLYHLIDVIQGFFPSMVEYQGEMLPNDIKQVIRCLFGKSTRSPTWSSDTLFDREAYARRRAQFDPSSAVDTFWFETHAEPRLQCAIASLAFQRQHYAAAVKLYQRLLQSGYLPPIDRAMIFDILATLPVLYGVKAYRQEALTWIEEAKRLVPSAHLLDGTYGALLIENGQTDQGMAVLKPLVTDGKSAQDREISAYYLAKGFHVQGDQISAQHWLEKGRELGNFQAVSDRIEREMMQN